MKKRWKIISMMLIAVLLVMLQSALVSAKSQKLGTTVANQGLFEPGACEYGDRIYYALGNRLCSVKKDGTDERELCTIRNEDD